MQALIKAVLLGAAALAATASFAGEAPAKGAAGAQRELLQPPKMAVASPITDRFAVRGLFYLPTYTTEMRYDSSTGVPGTVVSGEDTLGLPDQRQQVSVDMMFRIGDRHRVYADFYQTTRAGDVIIDQPVFFGDEVYLTNDRVVSLMDLRKLGITYLYSVFRSEKWELGAGLGLHLLQVEGKLETPARFVRENADVAGPFATLAVDATWRFTRRFSLNLSGNYLDVSIKNVTGGYQSMHGDVQFRVRPNFALGLGYTQARFRIDSTDADFPGYFLLQNTGPEAFVRISF